MITRLPVAYNAHNFIGAWWANRVTALQEELGVALLGRVTDLQITDSLKAIGALREALSKLFDAHVEIKGQLLDQDGGARVLFYNRHGCDLIDIDLSSADARVAMWTTTTERASEILKLIGKTLPARPLLEDDGIVPIAFWRQRKEDADFSFRELKCPSVEEIFDNYSPDVGEKIRAIATAEDPDQHGKIILWYGPPGTGKTFAIRALCREWIQRLDATVEVVLDPETLFQSADYMYSVLLADPTNNHMRRRFQRRFHKQSNEPSEIVNGGMYRPRMDVNEEYSSNGEDASALRLIIIEDYAKLFSTECRSTDGFARLLNLSDGIIGQGIRVVFLLTANEKIEYIDPAIKRPGRCIQIVNFDEFTPGRAKVWFEKKQLVAPPDWNGSTLADLYAVLNGIEAPSELSRSVGFGGSK